MCYILRFLCCFFCCCKFIDKKGKDSKHSELPSNTKSSLDRPNSMAVYLASSPSKIITTDLTRVYEIPNKDFQTEEDVIKYNDYQIDRTVMLGKGLYGEVFKAVNIKNQTVVAVKIMNFNKNSHLKTDAKNELFVLERTSHPHIMPLITHFIIKDSYNKINNVFIFMPLAENKSLSDYVRHYKTPMNESTAKRMFAQMVSAVDHMHSLGLAHRDLKLGNILLDKNFNVLISDFGLSRMALRRSKKDALLCNKRIGTIPYMAPEILLIESLKQPYEPLAADIWALGVILFSMANRYYPFGDEPQEMNKKMIRFERKTVGCLNRYGGYSPDFDDIVRRLLRYESAHRIKMSELVKHIWIKDNIEAINKLININRKNSSKETLK